MSLDENIQELYKYVDDRGLKRSNILRYYCTVVNIVRESIPIVEYTIHKVDIERKCKDHVLRLYDSRNHSECVATFLWVL